MKEKKKKECSLEKKYTAEDAKKFILESTTTQSDPNDLLRKFAYDYMPLLNAGDDSKKEEISKSLIDISFGLGITTGYSLMKAVNEEHRGLAVQMKRDMQSEFDCKTTSEKALIDLAVNAYIRNLYYSGRMLSNQDNAGNNHNNYRKYLSQEIDRAQRHYISAIETLKSIKQPALKVNVKTKTAFFADKQQFNNNPKNNEAK